MNQTSVQGLHKALAALIVVSMLLVSVPAAGASTLDGEMSEAFWQDIAHQSRSLAAELDPTPQQIAATAERLAALPSVGLSLSLGPDTSSRLSAAADYQRSCGLPSGAGWAACTAADGLSTAVVIANLAVLGASQSAECITAPSINGVDCVLLWTTLVVLTGGAAAVSFGEQLQGDFGLFGQYLYDVLLCVVNSIAGRPSCSEE